MQQTVIIRTKYLHTICIKYYKTSSVLTKSITMRFLWILSIVTTIIFLSGALGDVTQTVEIETSDSDKNEYRGLILSNRLQVLLIRDVNATKAAASLAVGAGSFNNPPSILGLAHFVEHALYLGNEKYPEENGLKKYLAANGGSSRASCGNDATTFFLDVAPSALNGTLDRFSQMFVSPLFRESSLEKEVNAVNTENEMQIPSDFRRENRVSKETAKPSHPFFRFSAGNRETIWTIPKANGLNMSEELNSFFNKFYSANIMRLVVLGPQPLDELQAAVDSTFSAILDKNIEMPRWDEHHYGPDELARWIRTVPQGDLKVMRLTIPMDVNHLQPRSKPLMYLASLLEHGGEGGLASLLKKKNLVLSLKVEIHEFRGTVYIQIPMSLTNEGLDKAEEIVCLVFTYINLLRTEGPQEWYWKELQGLKEIAFRFKQMTAARSLLNSYSSKMLVYPLEDTLTDGNLLRDYNASLITEMLNLFTPERTRVLMSSKTFESTANITEKYYGVKYSTEKIDPSVLKMWGECTQNGDLRLPSQNEFIPSRFELKERVKEPGIVPTVLKETPFSQIWFLQDSEFLLPKAVVSLEMMSPQAYLDPLSVWLEQMMTELVNNKLMELSYNAHHAELSYSFSSLQYGIELMVSGYDDKLPVLFEKAVETLTSFNFSEVDFARFESIKDRFRRKMQIYEDHKPPERAKSFLSLLLRDKHWSYSDILSVNTEDVNIERVAWYAKTFFSQMKFRWLFYGNLVPAEALQLAENCEAVFKNKYNTKPLLPSQIGGFREVEIPKGTRWLQDLSTTTFSTSAVVLMYQLGPINDAREVVLAEFLKTLTHLPFFDQMRTQEKLGYYVDTLTNSYTATTAFGFFVEGQRHPAYVYSRIRNFISNFSGILSSMSEDTFNDQKNSFRAVLQGSNPKTQLERYFIVANEIRSERMNFELDVLKLNALNNLTLAEFVEFFNENLREDGRNTRSVLVNVLSVAKRGAGSNVSPEDTALAEELASSLLPIGDVTKWKKQRSLYPMH